MENNPPITPVPSAADEQSALAKLSLLYVENAKVAATFWEWRHKLMDRFFAAIGGIVIGAAWIYQQKELRHLLCVPLLLGSVYSAVSYLMDEVNRKILVGCYETGKEIERQLGPVAGAYTRILDRYKTVNYSVFLRTLYLSAGVLLLVMSVLAVIFARTI